DLVRYVVADPRAGFIELEWRVFLRHLLHADQDSQRGKLLRWWLYASTAKLVSINERPRQGKTKAIAAGWCSLRMSNSPALRPSRLFFASFAVRDFKPQRTRKRSSETETAPLRIAGSVSVWI